MNNIEITRRGLADHLDKLPAFLAVARLGSISRAAERAHLSQSALSHLIAKLEESVGVALFTRRSHGLEPTEEGRTLARFAERLELDLETLAARLVRSGESIPQSIRVGTHETLAVHLWPRVIARSAREGTLKISLLSGRVDELVGMLIRGDLHATVTVEPTANAGVGIEPLYEGRLEFYAATGFELARKPKLADLRKARIFTDSHAHVRQGLPIPQALAQLGLEAGGGHEVSSFEAAINLAAMGLGVAVIPDRNAATALKEKRIRKVDVRDLPRRGLLEYRVCLATRAARDVPPLRELLLEG